VADLPEERPGGATGPAGRGPDLDPEALGPDVIVGLEPSAAGAGLPWAVHAHATDSAQPVPGRALPPMDSASSPGDRVEGPEPGARYWFGPHGLVKVSMEAQR
jgi:hypothetical protein